MDTKSVVLGFVALVSLVLGGLAFFRNPTIPALPNPPFGSVTSADIYSPYLNVNGFFHYYNNIGFAQGTTTVCNVKSPAATTTLARISTQFKISSTTATTVTYATSTAMSATTTPFTSFSVAASAQISYSWPIATSTLLAPNTWVAVSMTGGAGTFSPSGSCVVNFAQL